MSDQNVIPENTQIYANFGQPFQPGTLPEVQYLEVEPIFEAPPRISSGGSVLDPSSIVDSNGRTYHNYDTDYLLPNDGDEQDRLDLQHHIFTLLLNGKLGFAPVHDPQYALDIATGTGIWAIEFAEKHPECQVVGTDISKIQPNPLVPNCSFEKEDSEKQEWLFPYLFDYVHLRAIAACFDNTKLVLTKAFNHMRPGGWIELQDMYLIPSSFDGTHEGTAWQGATLAAGRGLASLGKDLYKVLHYAEWLKEVGFVDIRWDAIPWPIGAWPKDKKWKEIGRYSILNSVDVLESIRKLVELSGLSKEETQEMIEQGKREVKDPAMHGLVKFYVVYGRKPFVGEMPHDIESITA